MSRLTLLLAAALCAGTLVAPLTAQDAAPKADAH
jgi:hypothetical protein